MRQKNVLGLVLTGSIATAVLLFFLFGLGAFTSQASSSGRVNYSGNPATGGQTCSTCHNSVGTDAPEVWLDGPTAVVAGQTVTYTLTISGGLAVVGGFNVSASDGQLQTIPDSTTTRLDDMELTHTAPPPSFEAEGTLTFSFYWTAPQAGVFTLYGAGVSADNSSDPAGDVAHNNFLTITATQQVFLPLVTTNGLE